MFEFLTTFVFYVFQPFFACYLCPKSQHTKCKTRSRRTQSSSFYFGVEVFVCLLLPHKTELLNKVVLSKIVLTDQKYFGSFKNFINLAQFSTWYTKIPQKRMYLIHVQPLPRLYWCAVFSGMVHLLDLYVCEVLNPYVVSLKPNFLCFEYCWKGGKVL